MPRPGEQLWLCAQFVGEECKSVVAVTVEIMGRKDVVLVAEDEAVSNCEEADALEVNVLEVAYVGMVDID